eukprot:scaffold113132_cov33-Attheya_sp.AAC.1
MGTQPPSVVIVWDYSRLRRALRSLGYDVPGGTDRTDGRTMDRVTTCTGTVLLPPVSDKGSR